MQQYGGFKIITARPMILADAHQAGYRVDVNNNELEGYEVTYDTGYKSWSPKSAFDKAYTPFEPAPGIHPAVLEVLKYFSFSHLPPHLQEVSAPFAALAYRTAHKAPACPETTVAIRKLLEAKDAAVRAALP